MLKELEHDTVILIILITVCTEYIFDFDKLLFSCKGCHY